MNWLTAIMGEGGILGGVVDVLKSTGVIPDPALKAKLQEMLLKQQISLEEIWAKQIESVNATMREEAKSEHWMQWSWRPTVGFTFSGVIINNYILVPYLAKFGVLPLTIPGELWTAMLVVLGVAAGTRGYEKIMKANGNGK